MDGSLVTCVQNFSCLYLKSFHIQNSQSERHYFEQIAVYLQARQLVYGSS